MFNIKIDVKMHETCHLLVNAYLLPPNVYLSSECLRIYVIILLTFYIEYNNTRGKQSAFTISRHIAAAILCSLFFF